MLKHVQGIAIRHRHASVQGIAIRHRNARNLVVLFRQFLGVSRSASSRKSLTISERSARFQAGEN